MEILLIANRSQGNSALPGNEIGLAFGFGAGEDFSAGRANDEIENVFAHFFNSGFSGNDGASVDVDAVGHFLGEVGIGGKFDNGRDGIAGWRAEASGK